jgi:hypothetical protein
VLHCNADAVIDKVSGSLALQKRIRIYLALPGRISVHPHSRVLFDRCILMMILSRRLTLTPVQAVLGYALSRRKPTSLLSESDRPSPIAHRILALRFFRLNCTCSYKGHTGITSPHANLSRSRIHFFSGERPVLLNVATAYCVSAAAQGGSIPDGNSCVPEIERQIRPVSEAQTGSICFVSNEISVRK